MAIVEYTCTEPSLFYYGGFKLMEAPDDISASLDYLYAEIFVDPWANWDKISRVFETFGTMSNVSNASFSKNEDIGDGVKTPWQLNSTSIGTIVQCYNIAKDLGILVDSTSSQVTFVAQPDAQERINRKKWQALATQYQIIKTTQTTQSILGYGLSPIIDSIDPTVNPTPSPPSDTLDRSPQQLQMYQSYLVKTAITAKEQFGAVLARSALYRVSQQTLSALFGSIIGILRGGWWYDLITIAPINVEYEYKTIIETATLANQTNGYMDFTHENYVAHLEYAVFLPEDTTGDVSITLKECYGIEYGDSQTWDCSTCLYAPSCNSAAFINPIRMDGTVQNRINYSFIAGQRVRIKYKKVSIV